MPPYDPDYDYGSDYSQQVAMENTQREIADRGQKQFERDKANNEAFKRRTDGTAPVTQQTERSVEIGKSAKTLVDRDFNASLETRKAKRDQQHKFVEELMDAVHEHQKRTERK